jgi:hypothetical protein
MSAKEYTLDELKSKPKSESTMDKVGGYAQIGQGIMGSMQGMNQGMNQPNTLPKSEFQPTPVVMPQKQDMTSALIQMLQRGN